MPGFTVGMIHQGLGRISLDGSSQVDAPGGTAVLFPTASGYRVDHIGCTGRGICATTVHLSFAAVEIERGLAQAGLELAACRAIPLRRSSLAALLLLALQREGNREDPLIADELQATLAVAAQPSDGAPSQLPTARPAAQRRVANAARELLASRFDEPVRLGELAGELGCSPPHLCRAFRRQTGGTLTGYLRRLRVSEGARRLLGGERDLCRLAGELGFASHSHFSMDFRRVTGTSPSEFRKRVHRQ